MEADNSIENIAEKNKSSNRNEESLDEEKSKLKRQIKELKSVILQIEWSLDMLRFGRTQCLPLSEITNGSNTYKIPDINVQLETDLFRYCGFYCVKFSRDEYIFNFSSVKKYDEKCIFAVQILNNKDTGSLGKWVMPIGVDLNDLTSEIPISELKNIPRFLRTCKHYIDCYFIRHEQYIKLKEITSGIKNCNLQTNLGYRQVTLNVIGVHDTKTDSYLNVIIYLLYNISEARPYKVEVDLATEDELDQKTKKQLEKHLGCFKKFDLSVAFEKIFNEEPFIWVKEDDEDSPLEIDVRKNPSLFSQKIYHSNSIVTKYSSFQQMNDMDDTGYLENLSYRKKSLTLEKTRLDMKKRQRKIRKEHLARVTNSTKYSEQSLTHRKGKLPRKNVNRQPATFETISFTESASNANVQKGNKLKQTKLRFEVTNAGLQNNNDERQSQITTPKPKRVNKIFEKPITSTPIPSNRQENVNSGTSSSIDISDITVSDKNAEKATAKGNTDAMQGAMQKEKDLVQSGTPLKLLQNKMKRKVKSVQTTSQKKKKKK